MLPTITRPSHITNNSTTLIDNIFISEYFQWSFDSCVLLNNISDHLRTLLLAKQTRLADKEPLEFKSRKLNGAKIQLIKDDLQLVDWTGHLNSNDSNQNFNTFCEILQKTMNTVTP